MRITTLELDEVQTKFAKDAADAFARNPNLVTYDDGLIPGSLFAVRWGFMGCSVLVFRLDESFEPVNYQDLIDRS